MTSLRPRQLLLFAVVIAVATPTDAVHGQGSEAAVAAFKEDVHATAGLTCQTCHKGGSPDSYQAPPRTEIAPLCATCHSDGAYMRRFAPQARLDQLLQYRTSVHGRRMEAGETRVATCTDCHGAHGIRRATDARSPVAPLNVTMTCGRCHGDAALMKAFGRQAVAPKEWGASVHAAALLDRGDASAPTCAACHGSHGATPPNVTAVANVCAQCHVREGELFRASPKKDVFDAIGQPECLACHGNHQIQSPQDTWIGLAEMAVCAPCHDETSDSGRTIQAVRQELDGLSAAISDADALLARAERSGMLVDEGRLALRTARDRELQSKALVHAFALEPLKMASNEGLAAARRARDAGDAAMRELQVRRRGLAIATMLVIAFLVSLWVKIRRLPEPPSP